MEADTFSCPTLVVHGPGSAGLAGVQAKRLAARRALIVVDPGVKKTASLKTVQDGLDAEGVAFDVCDRVEPEPKSGAVDAAAEAVTDEVDLLIALGGGSTMDLAKGMRIVAECGGSIKDYKVPAGLPESFRLRLICIPSTSGTGSEVSWGGVYTDESSGLKFPVAGRSNAADVALVDAHVTCSMPRQVTALTGCDTLVHAVESYFSRFATPVTEALSLRAIELTAHSLQYAYVERTNLGARDRMARACTLAAMAFNTSRLGAAHGICLPLAARFHIPHGLAVGVMLPYVMEFNQNFCEKKFYDVAHALGVEVRGTRTQEIAQRAVEAIRSMYKFIKIPLSLRDLKVTQDSFGEIAELAMQTHQIPANPRPIHSKDELVELLNSAY